MCQCKALAASVLGDSTMMELSVANFQYSLDLLARGKLDVAILPWTEDMGLDLGQVRGIADVDLLECCNSDSRAASNRRPRSIQQVSLSAFL